jgi:CHASE3 domain sensor protein
MKSTRVAAIVIAGLLQSATLFAQDPGKMKGMDKQKHREIMPVHAKMMEEQKLQDTEIDKLRAEMSTATGEKRVDAIVAVLNKLIDQRKTMNEKMAAHLDR